MPASSTRGKHQLSKILFNLQDKTTKTTNEKNSPRKTQAGNRQNIFKAGQQRGSVNSLPVLSAKQSATDKKNLN